MSTPQEKFEDQKIKITGRPHNLLLKGMAQNRATPEQSVSA